MSKDGLAYQCRDCCRVYRQSSEYKATKKKYQQSFKGKASNAKCCKKHQQTEKGKAARKKARVKYASSDKGKVARARADKKYRQAYKIEKAEYDKRRRQIIHCSLKNK